MTRDVRVTTLRKSTCPCAGRQRRGRGQGDLEKAQGRSRILLLRPGGSTHRGISEYGSVWSSRSQNNLCYYNNVAYSRLPSPPRLHRRLRGVPGRGGAGGDRLRCERLRLPEVDRGEGQDEAPAAGGRRAHGSGLDATGLALMHLQRPLCGLETIGLIIIY